MMLTDKQFDQSRELAVRLTGIELCERHREALARRNGRAGLSGDDLESLLQAAARGEPAAHQQFFRLVTTRYTAFFRHPQQIERAARHGLEAARRRGIARLWSAAAATGEEAYSLAMAVLKQLAWRLHPDGLLMLDPAEDPGPAQPWFELRSEGVYVRRNPAAGPGADRRQNASLRPFQVS